MKQHLEKYFDVALKQRRSTFKVFKNKHLGILIAMDQVF